MMIDKVGGIGPNYGPRKSEPTAKPETPVRAGDNVTISAEATRAADAARAARTVRETADPERQERIKDIKARMERGEFNEVNDEQASRIAESLMGVFFR